LAAAARECPLVEKIVRIAASRVEELKDCDADQPKLGSVRLVSQKHVAGCENLCGELGRTGKRMRPRWQLKIRGLKLEHDGLSRQGPQP
jgi:hypothetical protein